MADMGADPADSRRVPQGEAAPIVLKKSVFDGLGRAVVAGSDGAR
jgi:hypothetical protein